VIPGLSSPSQRWLSILCLGIGLFGLPISRAAACGVSGPDGAWSCSLAEHEEEERPRWHVGVAGVYTSTTLHFSHELHADQTRNALLATAAYAPTPRLTLAFSAGAGFAGHLQAPDGEHDFSPGPSAAAGVTYSVIQGRPFVAVSGVLSGAFARTQLHGATDSAANYSAFDLRVGVVAGTTLFEVFSPYVVARVFGGPVFWHYQGAAVTGTDASHFQVGAGFSLRMPAWFDLFFEGVPLGEQALSGGVAVIF
jgi:hypothetical protein